MHSFLIPGIRLKRWLILHFLGMCLFAVGVWLLLAYWFARLAMVLETSTITSTIAGGVLLCCGMFVTAYSTHKIIRAFTEITNPQFDYRQLIRALLEKRQTTPAPLRIVGIGGGTGLSTLLRGLKSYPVELTAIVTVADDGGSSGRLRADLDIPPPGDIRNCLVALAEVEPVMEELFQHRFSAGDSHLNGHSVGNLIIAGLSDMTGDFLTAIQQVSRVLAVRGKVIPSARQALVLRATMADGTVVRGESAITDYPSPISTISIEPEDTVAMPEAVEAIMDADIIIVGPGSVYSSLLPNLIIPGVAEALASASALKFFVCNVMTQPGESDDFSASRHLQAVLAQLPCANPFHYVVINLQRPAGNVLEQYLAKKQYFVEPDLARVLELGSIPVTGSLLADNALARHNPDKLASCILEKVAEDVRWSEILRRHNSDILAIGAKHAPASRAKGT